MGQMDKDPSEEEMPPCQMGDASLLCRQLDERRA